MSLTADRTRLRAITKELSVRWEETKHYWKDARSEEFEERFMQELLARVDKAVIAIEKLEQVVARVRRDCE